MFFGFSDQRNNHTCTQTIMEALVRIALTISGVAAHRLSTWLQSQILGFLEENRTLIVNFVD